MLLMAISGGLKRWLVAGAIVTGIIGGVLSGINPGDTPIAMGAAWQFHQIVVGASGTGQPDGADGVDLSDVDGDGRLDVVSGHEQGLRLTLSFNPGPADVESAWPTVTLPNGANLCSAEDVIIGDVDGDGAKDIVAACETGAVRVSIFFAPAPATRASLLVAANWTQVDITASAGRRSMRAVLTDITGTAAPEIIVGGKESSGPCVHAAVGYYGTATPRTAASWTFTPIEPAGWIMNMYVQDLNGDGLKDIVYSDRERIDCDALDVPGVDNTRRGVRWLRNDGGGLAWTPFQISTSEEDHKWFSLFDADGDTDLDILDCRSATGVNVSQIFLNGGNFGSFSTVPVAQPSGVGQCQHATVNDVDEDGQLDYAFSYSNAQSLEGLAWWRVTGAALAPTLTRGSVAGILSTSQDTKFDNLAHVDVDGDGDDDWVTTEQHLPGGAGPGLGVAYWENPLITFVAPTQVGCALLTSGSQTTPDATSFVTAAVSPSANRPEYAIIQTAAGAGPVAPTATGAGLTWVQERTVTFSTRRITVLRALGTPTPGAVTFDFGVQTQTSAIWQIVECTNADTSGTNGSGATAQSASQTVAAGTTLTATLPGGLAGSTSRLLCVVGLDIASSVTPDADLTEYSDGSVAAGASTLEGQSALNQTACTPTFSSANAGAIVWEVRAP